VLQERRVRPIGGGDEIPVDVRLLSASNKDLRTMVAAGTFREDLYFRLQVVTVDLPPLRERREDIPLLVRHFLEEQCRAQRTGRKMVSPEVLALFMAYDWPGNVRELENEVKRAITLADEIITPEVLSDYIRDGSGGGAGGRALSSFPSAGAVPVDPASGCRDLNRLVEEVERMEIAKAIERSGGNKTKAASLLGISRFTLQRKLQKYEFPEADKGEIEPDAEPGAGAPESATASGSDES
jgi:DNA-binding NtrC family response regulator